MEGQRNQKKRIQETPRKPRTLEKSVIGISSTWKEEELERLKVLVGVDALEAKGGLIPEKWFGFGELKQNQSSISFLRPPLKGSAGHIDIYPTRRSLQQPRSPHSKSHTSIRSSGKLEVLKAYDLPIIERTVWPRNVKRNTAKAL
jgi:hypothetical protein